MGNQPLSADQKGEEGGHVTSRLRKTADSLALHRQKGKYLRGSLSKRDCLAKKYSAKENILKGKSLNENIHGIVSQKKY